MSNRCRIAIVLGMHRSGTSAVAGLLEQAGFCMPSESLPPHASDNPGGYFEPRELVQINNRLLAGLGLDWRSTRPIDPEQLRELPRDDIEDYLARVCADGGQLVFKDPRLCRLLPIWVSAMRRYDPDAAIVRVIRDPGAVAASLARRAQVDGLERAAIVDPAQAKLLWLRYGIDAWRHARSSRLSVRTVSYERLAASPDAVSAMFRWLADRGFEVGLPGRLQAHKPLPQRPHDNWGQLLPDAERALREGDSPRLTALLQAMELRIPAANQHCVDEPDEAIKSRAVVKHVSGLVPASGRYAGEILFVTGDPGTRSHIYRVKNPVDALNRLGRRTGWTTLDGARDLDLRHFRTIVLHRCEWGDDVERLLDEARRLGAKVFADIDDLVFDPELVDAGQIEFIRAMSAEDRRAWRARTGRYRQTLLAASAVLAPTTALVRAVETMGQQALLKPNGMSPETLELSAFWRSHRPLDDNRRRLGYASGSPTHDADFATVLEPLVSFLTDHPTWMLTVIGHLDTAVLSAHIPGDQFEVRPVVEHANLAFELARLDISMAPLQIGNDFCNGKSPLKWFEAAACGVPSVVAATDGFAEVVTDGVDGLVASAEDEWRSGFTRLAGADGPVIAAAASSRAAQSFSEDSLVRALLDQGFGQ